MATAASKWAALLPMTVTHRATTRAVLCALAAYSTDPGYCAYPSVTTMADALGRTRRSIQRALVELTELELIRPGDQEATRRMRADRRPPVYDVLTPELLDAERERASREAR
ncbi:helix-turn-helix domain-containing protein [Microbacterium sp.]|uniref:helix-turn-helix domain-containing protein n=1 Tax=Microbacterium sp. TaxID=51671 RepID=UPI003735A82C